MDSTSIAIAVVGAVLTFIGTLYATRIQYQKNRDEAREKESARQLAVEEALWTRVQNELERLQEKLNEAQARIGLLETERREWHTERVDLLARIRDLENRLDTGPLKKGA